MARDFDGEISVAEAELTQRINELEQIRTEFKACAASMLAAWIGDEAKNIVTHHPEITAGLGPQLLSFKADVAGLQARAMELVDEALGAPAAWWHLKPDYPYAPGEPSYYVSWERSGAGVPATVDKPLRSATRGLGEAFAKYGYLTGPSASNWGWDPSSHEYKKYDFEWTEPMVKTIEAYRHQVDEAKYTQAHIKSLRREKAQAAAADLWDKA